MEPDFSGRATEACLQWLVRNPMFRGRSAHGEVAQAALWRVHMGRK